MKKIILVLFLILIVSIPAFAKQKLEPDWVNFMTANDGTEWYYDVNSIKSKWGYVRMYNINVKNTKEEISKTDKYIISCSYKGWKPTVPSWKEQPYIINKKIGQLEWYKEGHLSGYLINEICDVK